MEEIEEKMVLEGPGVDLDSLSAEQRYKVLVVDDEPDMVALLKAILIMSGFNVVSATSGPDALKKLAVHKPDLVMLDVMMPEMDGWETLRYIKQILDIPVVVISALGTKEDVVNGLRKGIDDYVTKPFYKEEVVERVRAVLRRSRKPSEVSKLVFPHTELTIDLIAQEVEMRGKTIRLTSKEFAVLSVLAKHAPAVVSYQSISESIWGYDSADARKRIKYLAYLLRNKFDAAEKGCGELIVNVDRIGYKLDVS